MLTVLLGSLFLSLFLTVPIALALSTACAFTLLYIYRDMEMLHLLAQAIVTTSDSFPLMAIPFFMLVGTLMSRSGLAEEIIRVGEAFTGDIPGGLGSAAITACILFAAISGSGPAVVAALGVILIPAMRKRGYSASYAGSLVAAGATIGPVIPPSIPMIIYGVVSGASVSAMFAAGVLPGVIMGLGLILVNLLIGIKRGYRGEPRRGNILWILRCCWNAKWALILPVIILGGIYSGVFTPTEAAVIGSAYSLIVGILVYRKLNLKNIAEAMVEAGLLSSLSMFVLGGASTFGRLLTMQKIPQFLAEALLRLTTSPLGVMCLIIGFLFISGMFIDTISNIVLFTPLFLPIVIQVGFSAVFFGVLMTMILCIGMITPPVGVNLYVAQGISKASFAEMTKDVIVLVIILLLTVLVVVLFPTIALGLPNLLGLL